MATPKNKSAPAKAEQKAKASLQLAVATAPGASGTISSAKNLNTTTIAHAETMSSQPKLVTPSAALIEDRSGSGPATRLGTRFFLWLAAILAVAGAAYLDLAHVDPIFQRAEDFFGESAREMFALSRYITPFMYGKPFIDKPILSYSFMEASFALLGVSHFSTRVPFIFAALLTALLTACSVARLWGRREGLISAVLLCSSFGFFYFATMAMSDIWLTLCAALAGVWLFAGSLDEARRTRHWAVAAFFCALAVLAKGPIGLLLPVAACVLYLAIRRELGQIRLHHIVSGAAIIVILAGGWFALLWKQTGSVLVRQFFLEENLKRFAGSTYQLNIHRPFGFIPLAFLLYFIPYTLYLPFSFAQSWRKWRSRWNSPESRGELFLWCFLATIIGFFWAARSVNDYYVLPAMPACAALGGIYMSRTMNADDRVLRISAWMLAIALLVAGAATGCVVLLSGRETLRVFLPLLAWIFFTGALMAFLLARKQHLAVLGVLFVAICGGSAIGSREVMPIYLRAFPLAELAHAVQGNQQNPGLAKVPLAISSDLEHWRRELAFQTERVPAQLETPEEVADFLRGPGPRLVLLTAPWMDKLPPDITRRVQVVYQVPILMQGVPVGIFLDPSRLERKMERVSWVYSEGTIAH